MIKLLGKIPEKLAIACSGGPDSMAAASFFSNNGRRVELLYFNHGTVHGAEAEAFVADYAKKNNLNLTVGRISREKEKQESPEEFWRNERYRFFEQWLNSNPEYKLVTCHHLDDSVETWVFTSMRGQSKTIPYSRGRIIRPFLLNRKEILVSWCDKKQVPYLIDPSNNDSKYTRNLIRNELMPLVERINPGIYKVVRKKILAGVCDENLASE